MALSITNQIQFFEPALHQQIRDKFYYLTEDPKGRHRQFFENSGGSLRLKAAVEAKARFEQIPDCPERYHDISMGLKKAKEDGIRDIMQVIFGAKEGEGALITELTASQCMFQIVRTIMENAEGTNVVTTSLEHPSAFDATQYYAERRGMELRVAMANKVTGRIETEDVLALIDENTAMINVMSASNISGAIMDMEAICKGARAIRPDVYIVSDAVQHMPHGVLDVAALEIDGMNFAPYKAFGIRGCGYGYVSERVARMSHHKLIAKDEKEWELGTFPHPNYAAISAVVDYVCWIGSHYTDRIERRELFVAGMDRIHLQEHSLLIYMMEGSDTVLGLRHIPGVHVYVDSDDTVDRDLISAIGIDGIDFPELTKEYYARGITVFDRVNTSLYSKRIVESIGLIGAIRVSPLHCHNTDDIDEFLRVTAEIAAIYASGSQG